MSDYSAVAPPPQNFNQSSAFAAALQRAKQIAAKINPATGTPSDNRPKRPLEEGQEPDAKKGPGNLGPPPQQQQGPPLGGPPMGGRPNPTLSQANMGGPGSGMGGSGSGMGGPGSGMGGPGSGMGGPGSGMGGPGSGMGGPSSGMGGLSHSEDIKVPDKMVGLRMNSMNQGMGSGGHGMGGGGGGGGGMGGGPGLGGGRSFVEIMIPGPKVGLIIGKGGETIKQLQEKSGAKMVVIQEGPNQEQEKPLRISGDPQKVEFAKQLVYDLIAEKEMQNFNRGGRRSNDDGGYNNGGYGGPRGGGGGGTGFEVLVPRAAVGVVIGKGGDMIKKIQAETGARVQFQQAREEGPGERSCFLQGNPKQVEEARMRIEELIESVQRRDTEGNGGGPGMGRRSGGRGRDSFDNRGGNRNGGGDFGGGGGGWNDRRNNQPPGNEVSFNVPSNKCGVIIGRGGDTIKQINAQSGAYCELDRRNQDPNSVEKTFTIRGDPEAIETAKRIIQDKIQMSLNFVSSGGPPPMSSTMPTAYPGMAPQGYTPQGWGMPPYQQPQTQQQPPTQQWGAPPAPVPDQSAPASAPMNAGTGQADYSLQWAEYYRSLGMHREAEIIEQQAKNKAATQPVAVNQAPAPPAVAAAVATPAPVPTQATANGQLDYSAQWADYYRGLGKIKEAEAIEASMKNKSTAGVGMGQAPVAAAPTQPAPAPYSQQPYGAYQPTGAYYGAQHTPAVPAAVTQSGYGFPAYGYGGPNAGGPPTGQEN